MKNAIIRTLIGLSVAILLAAGCTHDFGKVDQGRVIKFDKEKKEVTFIRDAKAEPGNPQYIELPPVTYKLPEDPHEVGPLPKAGGRMKLDDKTKEIKVFDFATQQFKIIPITIIDEQINIAKDHPLVFDAEAKKAKPFPVIDKAGKKITIYSSRQKILITFSVPEEYFAMPDSTWDAGDEVRVYYKEPGKSLRFMNITKTDIFKK